MQDAHEFVWKATLQTIDVGLRGKRVLDVGCNRGGFLRMLYDQAEIAQGFGYDPAAGAVEDARRLAGERHLFFEEPRLGYVTASINVQYRRPTPIAEPVTVWARVVERSGRRTTLACRLESQGRECVRAEVVAVRTNASIGGRALTG